MPGTLRVALLDPYDDALQQVLRREMPDGWRLAAAGSYDDTEQIGAARDADVVLAGWAAVPARVIASSDRLRIVQKLGIGTDRVDVACCRERGIAVARLAGVNAATVAEHVILLILAALRRLPESDRRMRRGEWFKEEARAFQRELRGRTVGLVGLGHVGRAVAQRLQGFEVRVVYTDVVRGDPALERELGIAFVALDDLVAVADVVSLHVPLTGATRHLFDARRIAAMKPGAVLVNCARGGLVDEVALGAALRGGHLLAAGLDTFEREPLGNTGILASDNVIVTPHCAGATADNFGHVARRAVANVRGYLASGMLPEEDRVYLPPVEEGSKRTEDRRA